MEEATALKDETEELLTMNTPIKNEMSLVPISEANDEDEPDPFGLNILIPSARRDEKLRVDSSASKMRKHEVEESKRSLKSEREALILCLEIAAKRYKIPWSDLDFTSSIQVFCLLFCYPNISNLIHDILMSFITGAKQL